MKSPGCKMPSCTSDPATWSHGPVQTSCPQKHGSASLQRHLRWMDVAWALVSALCLLSGACAQDWNVTLGPGPLAGWVGSCVTIPCSFSHPPGWTVRAVNWTRDRAQTVYHSDGTRIHPAFVGRVRYLGDLQGNCSLRVSGLRPSDQGTYRFWFEAERGGEKENKTRSSDPGQRLNVSAHPWQPSLGNRTEPGPALICSVGAACPQRPSWYGPDGAGPSPDQTPGGAGATELRISPSQLGSGVVLRCRVNGTRDECESEPPPGTGSSRVEVSRPAGQAALREGDGLTLHCQALALQPGARYVWSRGAVWLPEARQDWRVEKAAVSDGGSYACGVWVSGPGWGQLSLSAREPVEVQHAPKGVRVTASPGTSLRERDSVTLRCNYSSSLPAPTSYTWYRGSQRPEGSQQELVLKNITAEQAGEYRCQVANEIGQSQSPPIPITVQYAPTSLRERDSVTLRCNYSSSLPAPTSYTWYRGSQSLKRTQQEFVLENITAEQAGEYRCQVANEISQSQSPPIPITVQCGGECQCLSPSLVACIVLAILLVLVLVNVWACYLLQRGRHRGAAERAEGGSVELFCRPIMDSPYEELQGPTEDLYSQLDCPRAGSRSALPLPQLPGTPQHGQDLKPKEGTSLSGAAPPAGVNGP